ncbi:MAG: methylated-DNA--[protein]-cysteine S-methyltransferase [Fibrobacteres bacterium]|nr:methylated-DNA--[protein]-cysteine S-methyltransferase [Fibrobacterota bacterium]
MTTHQIECDTALGKVYLIANERGLCGVYFGKRPLPLLTTLREDIPSHACLREASLQLKAYSEGRLREFDLTLDFSGTPFQESVWNALRAIPFGATISYKQLAERIRNPKAVRAVGSANGRNPLCIIIPCHRVIAADGSIGGYSGGLPIKEKLLALERTRK